MTFGAAKEALFCDQFAILDAVSESEITNNRPSQGQPEKDRSHPQVILVSRRRPKKNSDDKEGKDNIPHRHPRTRRTGERVKASFELFRGITGPVVARWCQRRRRRGRRGGSNSIISSNGNQLIAQSDGFTRIETRYDNARVLCARGVQQQDASPNDRSIGPLCKIHVLQPRQRQELVHPNQIPRRVSSTLPSMR